MPEKSAIEVIDPVWWVGAISFGTSLLMTPIVRYVAYRVKIVDRPDDLLKPHGRPVAYLGGVAMCVGLLAGLAAYAFTRPDLHWQWQALATAVRTASFKDLLDNPLWNMLGIGLACVIITVVGLMDDVLSIAPRKKVLGQVLAAAVLLAGGIGTRMALLGFVLFNELGVAHVVPPFWVLYPLSAVMCLVVVIAACNATNLLDGLDGLCGGVTGIIALGFLALAIWLAMWNRFPGTDELRVVLCLTMAGAVLGFLPYNVPPASIFMGDAGSMLLGFFVATMIAMFCQEGTARWFVAACAVFALPILDTGLAVVRRLRAGVSIFAGDRSHLYDQLVDRGMTVKQVVVLFYVLAAIAALLGVGLAIYVRLRVAVLIYVFLLMTVWAVFYIAGMITPDKRRDSREDKTVRSSD